MISYPALRRPASEKRQGTGGSDSGKHIRD